MEPTRSAYVLLKKHLLHFDATRVAKPQSNAAAPTGLTTSSAGGATDASAKRLLMGNAQSNSESVAFIFQHISAIHRMDGAPSGSVAQPTAKGSKSANLLTNSLPAKSQLGMELEYAVYCMSKASERFPSPQLSLIDLMRAVVQHMVYHRTNTGVVSGEYILKALMMFFGAEKYEGFSRYAMALMECGCLRVATIRGVANAPGQPAPVIQTIPEFERAFFHVGIPTQVAELSKLVPFQEAASRLLCLFCARAVQDGANELIYMSHSRWLFGPPPAASQQQSSSPPKASVADDVDDPCSPFPERFRRGVLGPLFQYVSGFCMSECTMLEALHDQCAIVRLNGVKFALAQLSPSNAPPLVFDADSGKKARCNTSVSLLMGFPEHMADNVIHIGVKKLLDAVTMCETPRRCVATNESPEEFRLRMRHLGARMFSLSSAIFFRPEAADTTFIDHHRRLWRPHSPAGAQGTPLGEKSGHSDMRELGGLVDNAVDDQMGMALRAKRPYNGLPTSVPFALNHRLGTHTLSRRSCSSATQILLSARDACAPFGGCVCTAMFYHGTLILSDCHPYVTALLGLRARWSFYDAAPPRVVNIADEGAASSSSQAMFVSSASAASFGLRMSAAGSELWSGLPPKEHMPQGVFADSAFGEPTSGTSGSSQQYSQQSPMSPSAYADERPESPRSPTSQHEDSNSLVRSMAALHPHLFHIACYLSDDIAQLLPRPTTCPKEESSAEDAREEKLQSDSPVRGRPKSEFPSAGGPASNASSHQPSTKTSFKYECAEDVSLSHHLRHTMSSGVYHGVHLSASGIDIVLVLPLRMASAERETLGTQASCEDDVVNAITTRFMEELSTITREINSLSSHMARSDSIPREVEISSGGGTSANGDESMSQHVDPTTLHGATSSGSRSSDAATPPNVGVTVTREVATTAPLCLVHDLALGTAEFLGGVLGSQEETPHAQRVVPSALMLNRATVFLREANAASQLLGTSLRLPRRHPDDTNTTDAPFAVEATTRVILGRSAFSEKDKRGPHNVVYARQSAGQQVYFGVSNATAGVSATLRGVEEHYVQFASSCRSHTVVI